MSVGKRRIFYIIGGFLFLILCFVLLYYNINNKRSLSKLNSQYDKNNLNNLAIYVEKEDGTGYEESDTFPSDMLFNKTESRCLDMYGNILSDSLIYNNGTVKVSVANTAYCYLFFDKIRTPMGEYLLNSQPTGLNTNIEGGMYRYQGTSVNNYICFGTSNKDSCLTNTDAYLYRIIGITEDGKVKLIKNYALESTMEWSSDYTIYTPWESSSIYLSINGSSFFTNSSYMPYGWEDKIETTTWKYGNNRDVNVSANSLYSIENSLPYTVNAKIGLMYAHDYAYAYQSGGLNCKEDYETCATSWMFLGVCDSSAPAAIEHTMSLYGPEYGSDGNYYYAWIVMSNGVFYNAHLANSFSVRPVFYLKSSVSFVSGTGTLSSPFIIA